MKVLGLDTSGIVASAAMVEDEKLICEYTVNYKKTHSQTIMPMIEEICNSCEIDLDSIDLIAVASGPGSFTGLRIGAATAKGLAHGLEKPIIGVPTLDALAYNIAYTSHLICPIMDARRNQVYTALYRWKGDKLQRLSEHMAMAIEEILEKIQAYNDTVIFLGDGVPVQKAKIVDMLPEGKFLWAKPNNNMQRAASVAGLGLSMAKDGESQHYMEFAPFYLRKSQAEREYDQKMLLRKEKKND